MGDSQNSRGEVKIKYFYECLYDHWLLSFTLDQFRMFKVTWFSVITVTCTFSHHVMIITLARHFLILWQPSLFLLLWLLVFLCTQHMFCCSKGICCIPYDWGCQTYGSIMMYFPPRQCLSHSCRESCLGAACRVPVLWPEVPAQLSWPARGRALWGKVNIAFVDVLMGLGGGDSSFLLFSWLLWCQYRHLLN